METILMDLSLEASEGDVARVRVAGRIVQERLSAMNDPVAELLGEGAYGRRVLMNMTGAAFIDSSGVGWLLKCHRAFREKGGRLVLHSIPPIVSNVLRVMRLETVLCIQPDESAALGAVKETAK
jgi:anti-anti-sigma factor